MAAYTSNFRPQTHLTAGASTKDLWKFDGQTANDFSTNANDGTLKKERASFSNSVPKVATMRSKNIVLMSRTWEFAIGFVLGLMIFVSANVISSRQMLRGAVLIDAPTAFGFRLGASGFFGAA